MRIDIELEGDAVNKVALTPTELGRKFAELNSEDMAHFFNSIADFVEKHYITSFETQMLYVAKDECLNHDAIEIMKTIGEVVENKDD